MLKSFPTRGAGRRPSAGSRCGRQSASASALAAACAAAAILSSRAAAAAARPSTSCRALDQGPSVRACHPGHSLNQSQEVCFDQGFLTRTWDQQSTCDGTE